MQHTSRSGWYICCDVLFHFAVGWSDLASDWDLLGQEELSSDGLSPIKKQRGVVLEQWAYSLYTIASFFFYQCKQCAKRVRFFNVYYYSNLYFWYYTCIKYYTHFRRKLSARITQARDREYPEARARSKNLARKLHPTNGNKNHTTRRINRWGEVSCSDRNQCGVGTKANFFLRHGDLASACSVCRFFGGRNPCSSHQEPNVSCYTYIRNIV